MAPTTEYAVFTTQSTTYQSQPINNLRTTSVGLPSIISLDSFVSTLNESKQQHYGFVRSTAGSDLGQRPNNVADQWNEC